MKSLIKFINEKLRLNKQSKLQSAQSKSSNMLCHLAYLLGFDYDVSMTKNPNIISGGLKYVNSWISSNDVKDVEVYIFNTTWKNILNDRTDAPPKSKYIITNDDILKDMIDKEWFTLVWDTMGEIYINANVLYYSISNNSQSYNGNVSTNYMDFFVKKIK